MSTSDDAYGPLPVEESFRDDRQAEGRVLVAFPWSLYISTMLLKLSGLRALHQDTETLDPAAHSEDAFHFSSPGRKHCTFGAHTPIGEEAELFTSCE